MAVDLADADGSERVGREVGDVRRLVRDAVCAV
jgi:hypothetical protein